MSRKKHRNLLQKVPDKLRCMKRNDAIIQPSGVRCLATRRESLSKLEQGSFSCVTLFFMFNRKLNGREKLTSYPRFCIILT